jgi:hypothetical protein
MNKQLFDLVIDSLQGMDKHSFVPILPEAQGAPPMASPAGPVPPEAAMMSADPAAMPVDSFGAMGGSTPSAEPLPPGPGPSPEPPSSALTYDDVVSAVREVMSESGNKDEDKKQNNSSGSEGDKQIEQRLQSLEQAVSDIAGMFEALLTEMTPSPSEQAGAVPGAAQGFGMGAGSVGDPSAGMPATAGPLGPGANQAIYGASQGQNIKPAAYKLANALKKLSQ